jgi:DtxR family transcriptional regulator, Mn-dependent transcriptional regulator
MPRTRKTEPNGENWGDGHSQDHFSPVTENYLLSLYKLWEDSETPTVTQLTDALKQLPPTEGLGTSVPSVAGMIRRMQKLGLVDLGPDKRIRLTKKGLEGGEDIARRHRLAEWLVVRLLGMELERAHIEAHRLEHGMSREFEARLTECLGNPVKSPFGRPIPGTGQPKVPANALTLDRAALNTRYVVERVPEEDYKLIGFLAESAITPEHEVTVVEATPYLGVLLVATEEDRVSIGYNVAQQILVVPPSNPAPDQ